MFSLALTFFFFNDTATTEIYTLSLHDALPISLLLLRRLRPCSRDGIPLVEKDPAAHGAAEVMRSEEHTSELQSRLHLVCRLLLEKKNKIRPNTSSRRPQLHN